MGREAVVVVGVAAAAAVVAAMRAGHRGDMWWEGRIGAPREREGNEQTGELVGGRGRERGLFRVPKVCRCQRSTSCIHTVEKYKLDGTGEKLPSFSPQAKGVVIGPFR